MKRMGLVTAVILGGMLLVPWWSSKANQQEPAQAAGKAGAAIGSRTIKLPGIAVLQTEPDAANVVFSVVTVVDSVASARATSAAAIAKVMNAVMALKIPQLIITTQELDLNILRAEQVPGGHEHPKITGYQLIHTLRVNIENRNLDQLAKQTAQVVDTALMTGGNALNEVSFFKKDLLSLRREALEKAVQNAVENATSLAKGAGAEKVEIVEIVSDGNGGSSDIRYNRLFPPTKEFDGELTSLKPSMETYAEQVEVTFRF